MLILNIQTFDVVVFVISVLLFNTSVQYIQDQDPVITERNILYSFDLNGPIPASVTAFIETKPRFRAPRSTYGSHFISQMQLA